jgi:hypothetical protein
MNQYRHYAEQTKQNTSVSVNLMRLVSYFPVFSVLFGLMLH